MHELIRCRLAAALLICLPTSLLTEMLPTSIVVPDGSVTAQVPDRIRFDQHVRPILSNHCWNCHGPDEAGRKASLRLDQSDSATQAAESGSTAVVPGQPDHSELIVRISSDDPQLRMPPDAAGKPLTEQQKQILRRWIEQGGQFESHWAFTAPHRPDVPRQVGNNWPRNEIDHFVLQQLQQENLSPSPEAKPAAWLRRVTLDLTGLPPSPEQREQFLQRLNQETSDSVYESVVDQLMSTSAYAERMAMHWLDLARYADTNGYNNDETRTMWPWRDWVIDAFAKGLPYDQFLTEQLAGDLLPNADISQKVATGFSRNHVLTTEGGIIEEEYHVEYVADRVHTTATVFMALSLQCARCHDHKYDPVSQREYYQFAAFFNNVPDKVVSYNKSRMAEPLLKLPSAEQTQELASLEVRQQLLQEALAERLRDADLRMTEWESQLTSEQAAGLPKEGQPPGVPQQLLAIKPADRTPEQVDQLRHYYTEHVDPDGVRIRQEQTTLAERRKAVEDEIPATMVMAEPAEPRPAFILKRGQYDQRGEQVSAAFLSAAGAMSTAAGNLSTARTDAAPLSRLDLARWLTGPDHPLTARVAVNRWWEMLFGTGIVETTEDFGVQGALPSHPELLDWLAVELIDNRWNQRALLKRMVLSSTYRQSSSASSELLRRDPHNRLLARGPRFRLPAETVRDNALFVSGLLKQKVGGPSVRPYQPEGLWEDVSVERRDKYVPDTGDGLYRRSMYTFWKRTCPPPGMSSFDAPDRETCVVRRARTNTPLQALVLLNDPTYIEAARRLAERVLQSGPTDEQRLDHAFIIVLTREPDSSEQETLLPLIRSAVEEFSADPEAAEKLVATGASLKDPALPISELAGWTVGMSILLNLDETISKP